MDTRGALQGLQADVPRTFNPRYPSGYIFPFHYKHPVTGQDSPATIAEASGFLGNQTGPHGEANQAGDIEDVEPLHQFHPVIFNGLGT